MQRSSNTPKATGRRDGSSARPVSACIVVPPEPLVGRPVWRHAGLDFTVSRRVVPHGTNIIELYTTQLFSPLLVFFRVYVRMYHGYVPGISSLHVIQGGIA